MVLRVLYVLVKALLMISLSHLLLLLYIPLFFTVLCDLSLGSRVRYIKLAVLRDGLVLSLGRVISIGCSVVAS